MTRPLTVSAMLLGLVSAIPMACNRTHPAAPLAGARITVDKNAGAREVFGDDNEWIADLTDPTELAQLASFFPEMGRGKKSSVAWGWKLEATVEFKCTDGTTVRIWVGNGGMQTWSEGPGDWPVEGDFTGYLRALRARMALRSTTQSASAPSALRTSQATGP